MIIDRCNFDESQRLHWTELAKEMQELLNKEENVTTDNNDSKTNAAIIDHKTNAAIIDDLTSSFQNMNSSKKQVKAVCVVLPYSNDVKYCSERATSRGDDGIHPIDTNWSEVCNTMKREFYFPSDTENFAAVHVCTDVEDLNRIIDVISGKKTYSVP